MIDYSLWLHPCNPSDKNSANKVYACAQVREILSLQKLARHISSHGSPYTRDVIMGVMVAAVDCIREQLLAGNKVQLGDMGAFYVTFSGDGVDDATKFNPQEHIKTVNVRWERGEEFVDLKREASFNLVETRKEQAVSKKETKLALNEKMGTQTEDGEDPDTPDTPSNPSDPTDPDTPGGDVTE